MSESFWKWSFFILLLIWFFIRSPRTSKSLTIKTKTKKQVWQERILVSLNFVSMMFLPSFVVFSSRLDFATMNFPEVVRWIGLGLYALNLIFFLWCHKSLGKNWSMGLEIREDHKLVKSGPYKWIRHPMYTHFWILIISQGLILNNWIVMVYGVAAWGILYFLRVRKEEEMMIEEFGDKYREYMKETGILFPKLIQK